MAGRSGRRGKDLVGNIVILPCREFIDEDDGKEMILTLPQKIKSKIKFGIRTK